jgi:3'(2'), 5'-bisphosphate nucleotidase
MANPQRSSEGILEVVQVAGQIGMSLYGRERGQLKSDGTWVTRADGIIEEFLRGEFSALFEKDVTIFGEENGWTGSESASTCVIIDPIEGTDPFRNQIPIWGISVATFQKNESLDSWEPWLGVFSMPAANHLFSIGEFGKGAQWNGQTITLPAVTGPIPKTAYLGVSSDAHRWDLRGYPGKIRAFGVSGYQVALVATDALQATLLSRFHFYDIAGATLVLWAAGGELYRLSGERVSPTEMVKKLKENWEELEQPVLACHPGCIGEMLKANLHPW